MVKKMNDSNKTLKTPSVADRLISLIMKMPEKQQKALLKELEQRLSKEKRQHPRKPLPTFVDFVSEGRSHREFTRDISEGGLFIETSTPFSVGKEVVITFPGSSKPLKVAGRIARVEDRGIGVQFNIDRMLETLSIRSLLKDMDLSDGLA
jgi:hypothetical protein